MTRLATKSRYGMSKKEKPFSDELNQTVPTGLKWLYEMEALDSPVLKSNLYGNIYSFPGVVDTEILIDRFGRKMLIYIKFSWFLRKVWQSRKKETIISILDQVQELLPSFEFRVIEDKKLFDLAVQRMQEKLFGGGKNVKNSENPNQIVAVSDDNVGSVDLAVNITSSANSSSDGNTAAEVLASEDQTQPDAGVSDPIKSSRSGSPIR